VRDIEQYFDFIESVLAHSGAEDVEVTYTPLSRTSSMVNGVLYLANGSRLEFSELVYMVHYRPVKQFYRYQYVRGDEAVFRYDNAAHHPDLSNFPHHKHVGEERLPATEPTLSQVLEEVTALMGEAAKMPSQTPKRRRQSKR
jgi:hypothetical protein